MNHFLGIDMGGTNLRFGLVDEKGELTWSKRVSTEAGTKREHTLNVMKTGIREGLDQARINGWVVRGLGIGVPGAVDFEKGFIHTLVNVPGWENTSLSKLMEDEFHLLAFVDNDVNVMALGEHRFGAARGGRNVICLTLGTGVGGGIIVEGELYRGSSFTAGELGHIVVEREGPRCNCGNWGCLERYIGNRYLVERAVELYKHKSISIKTDTLTPESLASAAEKNDEVAKIIWQDAALRLGIVLAGLVNFFNPDLIVVGGGVAKAGAVLFEPLERVVRERSMKVPGRRVKIKPAQLGEDSGLIGAATLAIDTLKIF